MRKEIKEVQKELDKAVDKREKVKVAAEVEKKETKVLTSQLKDLEKKVEKFKPIAPSDSPIDATSNQYSSLERLIKSQRPLDKRNGKQWSKYLIAQNMSQAEMKQRGVWELLEKNKTKEISKDKLLEVMNDKDHLVRSLAISVESDAPHRGTFEIIDWEENYKPVVIDRGDSVLNNTYSSNKNDKYEFIARGYAADGQVVTRIIKITQADGGARYSYTIDSSWWDESYNYEEYIPSLSEVKHLSQGSVTSAVRYQLDEGNATVDWRSLTVESKLQHGDIDIPQNYQERLVIVPNLKRSVGPTISHRIQ